MKAEPDLSAAAWRKSTYSGGEGAECIEVADDLPGIVPVRDSKPPHGPTLTFRPGSWASFVANVKTDGFPTA
ncbi:hypothetical protein SSP35_03_00620 [Streptomyces sp. NBRC 110611]|uniref:DUF397 domain-containing protein n=1 Tax=Streptomyces sp. NBRC 110611 TaxID=1621259 RepID=UPI00082BA2A2|nr:DUF397 domain-containing protein [Streptomyces sp. NBRC 110611]GAU66414.1 hypothetical protein SSP35_03_00620 [Streptomyces sp. NBRC 110611]